MTPEQLLDNEIKLYCGEHNWLCFHANVGRVLTADNRIFSTGLPVGFPDLIIIMNNAKIMFIETKIKPRKPTIEQLNMQKILRERGFCSQTVYSLEEFISVAKSEI